MRPSKEEWYLNIAEQVALRSTCLRRNYGAVIEKNDEVLATGYGGAPRKTINCDKVGFCYRDRLGAQKGEHYEFCRASTLNKMLLFKLAGPICWVPHCISLD